MNLDWKMVRVAFNNFDQPYELPIQYDTVNGAGQNVSLKGKVIKLKRNED